MRRLSLSLALLGLSLPPVPAYAQQPAPKLSVVVTVGEPRKEDEFTAQELRDATTVLLTSKAPDVIINANSWLDLQILPSCFNMPGGFVCALDASLRIPLALWKDRPFEATPALTLWHSGGIWKGPRGQELRVLKGALDELLDEPVAAWRRLSEKQRSCWSGILNAPALWESLSRRLATKEHPAPYLLAGGPCTTAKQPGS